MIELNVSSEINRATKWLSATQREHIPFALSRAMQVTVENARDRAIRTAPRYLNRPNPKVLEKAIRRQWPRKGQVYTRPAKVFVSKWIAAEFRDLVYGDTVTELGGNTIITPVNANLDQFGNIQGLRGRRNVLRRIRELEEIGFDFLEVPLGEESQYGGLPAGLYERIGVGEFSSNLIMLFAYDRARVYQRQWKLDDEVYDEYRDVFPSAFAVHLTRAIRQGRRRG